MKVLRQISSLLLVLFSLSNYAQTEYIFVGYDLRNSFSSLCNEESKDYGMIFLEKDENYRELYKAIEKHYKAEAKYVPFTTAVFNESNNNIIGVIKTTTYCQTAKKYYHSIKFEKATSKEYLDVKLLKNEQMYKSQKLKNEILEIITIATIKNALKNTTDNHIRYK